MDSVLLPGEKSCPRCGLVKPFGEFPKNCSAVSGLYFCCKSCKRALSAQYLAARAETPRLVPESKVCSRCGQTKTASEFYRHVGTRDGLKTYCKSCALTAVHAYYHEHSEEVIRKQKQRVAANPEPRKAYERAYAQKHRQRIAVRMQAYRARRLAQGWKREFTSEQKIAAYEKSLLWRKAQPERFREQRSRYRNANRDSVRAWAETYRARRRATGRVTAKEWCEVLARYSYRCLACGATGDLHMDHVIPLARGGVHDVSNVQPLCGPCNQRKKTRTIDYRPTSTGAAL